MAQALWPVRQPVHKERISLRTFATFGNAPAGKSKVVYRCSTCGEVAGQWKGRCPACDGWNTMEKEAVAPASAGSGGGSGIAAARASANGAPRGLSRLAAASPATRPRMGGWVAETMQRPQRLTEVRRGGFGALWRIPLAGATGAELGRVLGGGVIPGSLTLVGGDPGVGKSTLLLQVAAMLVAPVTPTVAPAAADEGAAVAEPADAEVEAGSAVLYVSAEESVEQVGCRAERMGLRTAANVFLYSATRLEDVLREIAAMRPRAVIIDSIQTVYLDDVTGSAGSVSQVRECATALLHVAKREGIPIFLVGHVTKDGAIAGPRVLEHVVDAVLFMEGERREAFRLVRGLKNRYGATDEVGVFEMTDSGLVAVANPSALFLRDRALAPNASSAVTVAVEGTRPLLLEVQALCSPVHQGGGPPVRVPNGLKGNRLSLILAVLTKHARMPLYKVDLHINVVGGLLLSEPATDLAVALAIASSFYEQPIAADLAAIGEIGLGGELRPVAHTERRVAEASKLGFGTVLVPAASAPTARGRLAGTRIVPCRTVVDALRAALGPAVFARRRAPEPEDAVDVDVVEPGKASLQASHRLAQTRQRKLRDACVARVAQASRDEETAEDGEGTAKLAESPKDDGPSAVYIAGSLLAVMGLGIANRVLYKMALQPLGDYVFFLAQFQTFGYVAVYFAFLFFRYRSGAVTKDMLNAPDKRLFVLIGGLEAVSQLLGFIGASKLPGVVLPLLQQTILLWQVSLGYLVLGKRLTPAEMAGAALVIAGVCTAAWPSGDGPSVFTQLSPLYTGIFVSSMLFPALASIFKEKIFTEAKQKLGGKQLDLFVVNSFGSGAQAVCVFLLLPFLASLRGISFSELPAYLTEGAQCLMGISPAGCGSDCSGAPLLAPLYVACNLGFNIAALNLLRATGNVVQSLAMQSVIPLTIWAFTFPLPYLDAAPPLGANFVTGTGILLAGLLTYNSPKWRPALQKQLQGDKQA
ncbi:hypothetical protein WJX81_004492 [Elliptochloris bilobata]|uniref:RecA family profile 1 domain-containing protein n=1 Tax=Elliptochloris bilobata TaxID=381761 RepID=A0AAW1SEA7_9CHLO